MCDKYVKKIQEGGEVFFTDADILHLLCEEVNMKLDKRYHIVREVKKKLFRKAEESLSKSFWDLFFFP